MNLPCQGWRPTRKGQIPGLRTPLPAPLSQPELELLRLVALSVLLAIPLPLARPATRPVMPILALLLFLIPFALAHLASRLDWAGAP